jgi:Putative polyhydroxyalkanoic acid system protein (PHA_gran_rgn)
MRITVSHNKPKQEVMQAVNRSFDDLFRGMGILPLQIVNEKRAWNGSTLNFSFDAKTGFLSNPIKGFVEVTDKDITVDADLGLLEKLFPAKQASAAIEGKVRGLLT